MCSLEHDLLSLGTLEDCLAVLSGTRLLMGSLAGYLSGGWNADDCQSCQID